MPSDQPAPPATSLLLIANPIAGNGRGRAAADRLAAALATHRVPFERCDTVAAGHARELAAAAAPGRLIVVVGGDGTLHQVVNGLRAHDGRLGPLALLPSGSGDDFAASLALSRDADQLAAALARPLPQAFDVGLAEFATAAGSQRVRFVNAAGLGFDAEVAAEACKPHRVRGRLLYFLATLKVLRRRPGFGATLTIDDGGTERVLQRELAFLATCNGQFIGGGLRLVPDGRCDDGRLDAVQVLATRRRTILGLFAKLARGRHVGDPRVQNVRTARITVRTERDVAGSLDGEPLPLRVRTISYSLAPERLWLVRAASAATNVS